MPSAYLQWRFHSGERVVARGPLVNLVAVWQPLPKATVPLDTNFVVFLSSIITLHTFSNYTNSKCKSGNKGNNTINGFVYC